MKDEDLETTTSSRARAGMWKRPAPGFSVAAPAADARTRAGATARASPSAQASVRAACRSTALTGHTVQNDEPLR